jgi:hypothetical protein
MPESDCESVDWQTLYDEFFGAVGPSAACSVISHQLYPVDVGAKLLLLWAV